MGTVTVSGQAVRDQLEVNADELRLLFRVHDPAASPLSSEAMAAAAVAMRHANETVSPEAVSGQTVEPSPYGPVVFLDRVGEDADNSHWLGAFADRLTAEGWSGTLEPAPQPPSSYLPGGLQQGLGTTLFAALPLTPDPPRGITPTWGPPRWSVDEAATSELCRELVAWGSTPGADVRLETGRTRLHVDGDEVTDPLTWSVTHDYRAATNYVDAGVPALRRIAFAPWGQVTAQVVDGGADWRSRVDALREPLQQAAPEVAFLRTTHHIVGSWLDLNTVTPELPFVPEVEVRLHRGLWNRYLPDVHGIQVLTSAHLEGVGDLSGWTVQTIGPGRHLVEARDLEPWFAGDEPDPRALTEAREVFAGVLFTPEVVNAPGW